MKRAGDGFSTTGRSLSRKGIGDGWTCVTAGGEGRRMCPLVERWLGRPRPKQFCSFFGDRILLGYTLERAARMVGPERVVTVVSHRHRRVG